MPRRTQPDPHAQAVGARIRQLRLEQGLTLEKLAYESELGSKGYLSDIEKGLARPSLARLGVLADRLGVELFQLLVDPEGGERARLTDALRQLTDRECRKLRLQLADSRRRG